MIQSVRHELNDKYSFAELCQMAEKCDAVQMRVDVNNEVFLSPESMIMAIQRYCRDTNQNVPETKGELAAVIYNSLAESYKKTAEEIEEITGRIYDTIHIVGGGANADYLNQLTANITGKTVYSGPTEATALGNIAVQMMKYKEYEKLEDVRKAIYQSFPIQCFQTEK